MRKVFVLVAVAASTLAFAQSANALPPAQIFNGHGDIACTTQSPGDYEGQTWCGTGISSDGNVSTSPGVEGVPVDLNVAFPATGTAPYPVVMVNHGNGQEKFDFEFSAMQHWLEKGYAVYSGTSRGFGYTCLKNPDDPGCEDGYSHLMDFRFEVREAQNFLGILADEDLIQPKKIATTGNSYGAGMSMSLAVLKDRVMDLDGSLHPWQSPMGKDMEIAVSAPLALWSDFSYAMAPNGNAVDYIRDSGYYGPTGVMKESYIQGLIPAGRNAPAGSDPQADIEGWKNALDAGEPYDDNPEIAAMRHEVSTYHSSYGLPPTEEPAPLFIVQGFTDDIFPVDEVTRFYNRSRALFPDAPIGLFFGSLGHPRGQVQTNAFAAFSAQTDDWVDYYLDGAGSKPASDVTTYTQTCPDGTAAAGPFTAPDWASIAPGEIRVLGDGETETIDPDGGNFAVSTAFNPLSYLFNPPPAGTACAPASGAREPGSANYETEPAPAGGYTVMGATTVIAKVAVTGVNSQIAARLLDISPDGSTETLVSRGLWRPDGSGFQVFQLHANGWEVKPGHTLRLQMLPRDSGQAAPGGFFNNYGRPSNGQQPVSVSHVDLRIPVLESPGALGGLIKAPAPRVLPDRPGVELAKGNEGIGSISIADYAQQNDTCPTGQVGTPPGCSTPEKVVGKPFVTGKVKVRGKVLKAQIKCGTGNDSCSKISLAFKGAPKKGKKGKNLLIAKKKGLSAKPGQTRTVTLNLTGKARRFFKDKKKKVRKNGKKKVKTVKGPKSLRAKVLINGNKKGFKTVKRVAKVK